MQVLPKRERLGRTKGQRPHRVLADLASPENTNSDLGELRTILETCTATWRQLNSPPVSSGREEGKERKQEAWKGKIKFKKILI